MTEKLRRIMQRQSETRERLNALMAKDEPTDAETRETDDLRGRAQTIEVELREALAEPETATDPGEPGGVTVDAETRERLEIRSRTGVAEYINAAICGRAVDGAAAEYAAAVGVPAMGHLPLSIFPAGQPETRAITPGPAVDGVSQPVVPYVFERTASAALGIQMPTTGAGQVQIPRIRTAPPADTVAKDGAAPSTAAAVALDSESPKRITGQFEIRVEDLAVYAALEEVLGEAIRGAVGNELDEQTFNGSNASGDLDGLFRQAADVAVAGAAESYSSGIARFAAFVDGKHAYDLSDVRAVIGPATFARYMSVFANTNKGDLTLFDYLASKLGSLRVSDRMPAVAGTGQKGIVTLNAGPSPIRIYVWSALEIVRDPYTGAAAGKVVLTATALVSDVYVPHGQSMVKEIHPKLS